MEMSGMEIGMKGIGWVFGFYMLLIFVITFFTARGATTSTFFNANKQASWLAVAFGMVGVAVSGTAFLTIPGDVGNDSFSYLQRSFGYLVGYVFISTILLPIYYRHGLISIYSFLEERLGFWSQKSAAFFFIISRLLRTGFMLYIVLEIASVLLLREMGISKSLALAVALASICLYTLRGGINTVVWTDVLQTIVMLGAIGTVLWQLVHQVAPTFNDAMLLVQESEFSRAVFWETGDNRHFFDQFLAGIFVAVALNGLDQDIMQKNLSCRNLADAQKNMVWFSLILVAINLVLLVIGALVFIYASRNGMDTSQPGELVYAVLIKGYFPKLVVWVFFLGLLAATFTSADSVMVSLTTSTAIDFLDFAKVKTGEATKRKYRIQIHIVFAFLIFVVTLLYLGLGKQTVIDSLFRVASFTYGSLLGLFAFAILMPRWRVRDQWVPLICAITTIASYLVDFFSDQLFNSYQFGYELVIFTGLLTFLGLMLIHDRSPQH